MTDKMIAVPRELLEALDEILDRADTSEGYCCCGDSMENHPNPMDCGHSPVDAGDYYAGPRRDELKALLREAAQPCGCRIGTCESNADRRCRMADEIAEQQARPADEELRSERVRQALSDTGFRLQDDYYLAHGASLMSEDSHEIIHRDTVDAIVSASAGSEELRRDAELLDFVLDHDAFLFRNTTDAGAKVFQLWTQDEDENYHVISGEGEFFKSPRDAIRAAIAAEKREGS